MTAADPRKARDLPLLDAIDALPREPVELRVWRAVREGRDPTLGSPSQSRWCDGQFDVLYTALERDGAVAEINALLMLQPVIPSKMKWQCHELKVRLEKTLRIGELPALQKLSVDISAYQESRYERTQMIAEAAHFLGFDGLIVPSARWACHNLVAFTERLAPDSIETVGKTGFPINFDKWRRRS